MSDLGSHNLEEVARAAAACVASMRVTASRLHQEALRDPIGILDWPLAAQPDLARCAADLDRVMAIERSFLAAASAKGRLSYFVQKSLGGIMLKRVAAGIELSARPPIEVETAGEERRGQEQGVDDAFVKALATEHPHLIRKQIRDLQRQRLALSRSLGRNTELIEQTQKHLQWVASGPAELRVVEGTRSADLIKAIDSSRIALVGKADIPLPAWSRAGGRSMPQVLQMLHDWGSLVSDEVFESLDKVVLPAKSCLFEWVQADSTPVIVWLHQPVIDGAGHGPICAAVFVRFDHGWGWIGMNRGDHVVDVNAVLKPSSRHEWFIRSAIAAAVAIDAGVAVGQARWPHRQASRHSSRRAALKLGRSISVVHLNRPRNTATQAPHLRSSGHRKRLHFRRAHNRSYKSGVRRRIAWMLVGDPDLGWVDKTYRIAR